LLKIFKFMVPEIMFGRGTTRLVGESARRLGANRVFLVSDRGIAAAGWVDRAVNYLKEARLEVRVWIDVTPNPKDYEVERATEAYLESGCDVVVGLGGGSAIDAAKAVALLATNGGRIHEYSADA
jgi:alcohol dehydrogenase class IV